MFLGNGLLFVIMMAPTANGFTPNTEMKRAEIPALFKWDLTRLFASTEKWGKEKEEFEKSIGEVSKCKGELGKGAKPLIECLTLVYGIKQKLERLYSYASQEFSTDRDVTESKANLDMIQLLSTKFSNAVSFMEPELLALDENLIWGFFKEEKGLEIYRHYFRDLFRRRPHVLSSKEEAILALSGDLRAAPYGMLNSLQQDLKFPTILDEEEKEVQLSQANFPKYRASKKRDVRKECVEKFFSTLKGQLNSYASSLDMAVKANIFNAKSRGFESALHASLFPNNIPVDLYELLIETTANNLKDTLHRYVSLRKKAMGLDKIYYYDLYNPLIEKVEKSIDYNSAVEMIGKSLAPLGDEYVRISLHGMKAGSGWTDIYPNKGKRSGAYCTAVYGEHPYVFMNYMNELEDVFTLTHEYGHALHYYYSMKHQPFPTYEAPIFLAEIASTFNEELLLSHLLKNAKTKEERLFLLNRRLENIRTTVFRQIKFAEFEWLIHNEIERGGALTAQRISEIYGELIRKYYGPGFDIGENDNVEWAYVPHFYYNFYVYQYATGMMSAIALSQKVLKGEKGARERYLDFLKEGGSDYPLNILKKAGVDFSTPEPMLMTFDLFRETLDEFERELQSGK